MKGYLTVNYDLCEKNNTNTVSNQRCSITNREGAMKLPIVLALHYICVAIINGNRNESREKSAEAGDDELRINGKTNHERW